MAFNVQVKGLKELQDKFGQSNKIVNGALKQAMDKSTTHLKSEIRKEIVDKGINSQGSLKKSVNVYESKATKGVVGVGEKYGEYVEYGTRPHFPPVEPLERWARLKLGASGLGFVIAKKIARVGTKAKPFVQPVYDKNKKNIEKYFEEAIEFVTKELAS